MLLNADGRIVPFLCARYSVTSAFERDANDAVLDLTMDDDTRHKLKAQGKRWDPKKKKYVGQSNVSQSAFVSTYFQDDDLTVSVCRDINPRIDLISSIAGWNSRSMHERKIG